MPVLVEAVVQYGTKVTVPSFHDLGSGIWNCAYSLVVWSKSSVTISGLPEVVSVTARSEQPLEAVGVIAALIVIAPLLAWWMQRTHAGLALRAVGESPAAAIAAGISPKRTQLYAVLFAGAMAGLAGATLVLAQAGTFVEGMSAGRGFIAIAIVVLGRWRPLGVAAAALLFGAATSLQTLFQSMGWSGIPYQLFLAVPYVLTLVVLAVTGKRDARRMV